MKYPILYKAKVIKKYKMFFIDVLLEDNSIVTAYTKNKGGFKEELKPGAIVYISKSDNPSRKTQYSLELIERDQKLSGIDPHLSVKLLKEFLAKDKSLNLELIRQEVILGDSRLDLELRYENKTAYGEIKTIMTYNDKVATFPEAITERGQKHLKLLTELAKKKIPTFLFYIVQIPNIDTVKIRADIDSEYAKLMKKAIKAGLKVIILKTDISLKEIKINKNQIKNLII
jgi:sugar fermentation stimulation protein A